MENLHPMLRSSLKAIQLIVAVTYPNLLEYGYKPILQPFIDYMNELAKVFYLQCKVIIVYCNNTTGIQAANKWRGKNSEGSCTCDVD